MGFPYLFLIRKIFFLCMHHLKVLEKDVGDGISPKCRAKHRLTNNNSSVSWVDKKVPENVNDQTEDVSTGNYFASPFPYS